MELNQEYLKEILEYNQETGDFRWKSRDENVKKNRAFNAQKAGKIAGCVATDRKGYRYLVIKISKKVYKAHRLAFLYVYGYLPQVVDHINRDTLDNRIINLRGGDHTLNNRNKSKAKNNTSGVTGVYWDKRHSKWKTKINTEPGVCGYVGSYDTIEEAEAALKEVREKFNYTKNHGE